MQGTSSLENLENGFFLIPGLGVGVYTLEITHDLFARTIVSGVVVNLGVTTNTGAIELAMEENEIEVMIVTGKALLIDPTSASIGENLTSEEFSELPVGRDYKDMALLVPHANPSYLGDDNNVSGSTGLENKYFIDGVDVTDPNQGNGGTELPYNFIREVRVHNGGYEAEYRSSLGGIMDVVTNTGSNEFHGQVFGFFTDSGLTGTPETNVFIANPGDFTLYDYGFGIGGPIVKDKLWFYGALNPTHRNEDISIPDLGTYQDKISKYRFAGKLNWRVNENNDLVLSVFGDPGGGDDVWVWPITTVSHAENVDPFLYDSTIGGVNSILEGKHWVSERIMLRSAVSLVKNTREMDPATERGQNEILFIDDETGTWSGGAPGTIGKWGTIFTAGLHGTWIGDRHTWKGGLEYRNIHGKTDEGFEGLTKVSDDYWFYQYGDANVDADITVPSVYLQDSWRVTQQFRLNLGVRWDGQILASGGETAHEILDQWQPRVGFTYQLGTAGTQQFFGSAGRFYQEVSLNLPANQYSASNVWGYVEYDHDPRLDPSGGVVTEWSGFIPEGLELQGQHHDEFTLGYERQVAEGAKIMVRGVYRTLRRGIEDSISEETGEFIVGNVGYGLLDNWDPMKRDYQALELRYELNQTRYSVRASYVLSRNHGNYTGLFDSENDMTFPNLTTAFDDPETMPNSIGLLANDRTHVFKLSGSYRWRFGLTTGGFFTWMSGTPLNEFGTSDAHYHTYLVERGSAGRTPSIFSFNVRLSSLYRQAA